MGRSVDRFADSNVQKPKWEVFLRGAAKAKQDRNRFALLPIVPAAKHDCTALGIMMQWLRAFSSTPLRLNSAMAFASRSCFRLILRRLLLAPLVVAVPLLFVCCNVNWSADSSGFVIGGKGFTYVSLATKQAKELLAGNEYAMPCLIADGKQVATAQVTQRDKEYSVTLLTVDLEGKETFRSAPFLFETTLADEHTLATTHVSPNQNYFLVFLPSARCALLYDRKAKTFRQIEGVWPPTYLLGIAALWHGASISPVSPAGKGFIAVENTDPGNWSKITFYAWGGGEPVRLEAKNKLPPIVGKLEQEFVPGVASMPRWDNEELLIRVHEGVVVIQPEKASIEYREDPHTKRLLAHAIQENVLVLEELKGGSLIQMRNENLLEVFLPGDNPRIVELGPTRESVLVTRSPNREYAVIQSAGEQQAVRVVNHRGEIVY